MDRSRVWPDFRPEHVLFEDESLIAVHKPAGVPSQAARPERPDDLPLRLSAYLEARDGRRPYLGVHQRLDRDTSGVVLFTKRPEVNASIARQFEGRTVDKRYLAAVRGWSARAPKTTLRDLLRRGEDGRMEVVVARGKRDAAKGQVAVTNVSVRARRSDRALLEIELRTGRTHQARAQLAHAGAPIAGDPMYGGASAPRLLLHAAELVFVHPKTERRVSVVDRPPREMATWLEAGDLGAKVYDDAGALDAALAVAVERRWALGRSADRDPEDRRTTAFRLIHEDGDALPGLAVDVYGDHLVVQIHADASGQGPLDDPKRRELVLDRLDALGFDGIYLKRRPKQANVLVDTRREDIAPKEPVRGRASESESVILEEGVPFHVRLGDGLSTGIFLDQRQNRTLLRRLTKGARVANLFSYTCAFSVVAAIGGATRTVSVDASVAALERGRGNFELAGLMKRGPSYVHGFVAEDAFSWLARTAKKGEKFDVVVVDPPSYSSTKKRRFVAEDDYDELVTQAVAVLAKNGKLLLCCNHRGLTRTKFRKLVAKGVRETKRELVQLKDLPDPEDFPSPLGRDAYMKSVLVTVS